MKRLQEDLRSIVGIVSRPLEIREPFAEMATRFAREAGTVVLLSGGDLDCARYHILGIDPWLTIRGRLGETTVVIDGQCRLLAHAPLAVLDTVLARCRLDPEFVEGPVAAGLFGYLAYDLKDELETLPRTTIDDLDLPSLCLFAPSLIVVRDKARGVTMVHAPIRSEQGKAAAAAAVERFQQDLNKASPSSGNFSGSGRPLNSNFSRREYLAAVQGIKDYIAAGDAYQVNLSQRFQTDFSGDGFALFKHLYRLNPAPFFAYVNAGDHQIVSTSPERFVLRDGRRVETRPIKGTRPRGKTPETDRQMKSDLAKSSKDDAELSMIVDLLRNDIGKVCVGGSVAVTQHKRLETYRNVYHLVSVVEGTLAAGKTSVDLIRATFPGGSITGCPKIRAMEIIDELEPHRRHVYTGSIGYISFHDTMDLSIAIRTATITGGRLVFSIGGGIVFDSDPQDEYEETLHKGQTLMSVWRTGGEGAAAATAADPWVWYNGRCVNQDRAAVPAADLGLQYGFGFFETVRVHQGRACRLPAHLQRFKRTWRALFEGEPPDLTWEDIIARVIEKNGLSGATAAVKILATRGDGRGAGFNGNLLVTARPYTHRLATLGAAGLKLATYPHPRLTPLAEHKTLNYLYYYLAGVWARQQGADEAIILNPDGTISESNTANVLAVSGTTVIRPRSAHVLPGVMQDAVCQRLVEDGFSLVDRPLDADALASADMILLTNALMGAVPALSLDGRPLNLDPLLADKYTGDHNIR
jgi:para-aminobenzoate synthetase component 1